MTRGRWGYLVAVVVAVLSVAVWVLAAEPVSRLVHWTGADPPEIRTEIPPVQFEHSVTIGDAATVLPLTADRTWAIYSHNPYADRDDEIPDEDYHFFLLAPSCRATPLDGGTIDLRFVGWDYNYYFAAGERTWQAVYEVEVSEDGRYRLRCGWDHYAQVVPDQLHIALGADPDTARTVGRARRTFWGSLDALPALGLLLAAAIAVGARLLARPRPNQRRAAGADGSR